MISTFFKAIGHGVKKNSPQILTTLGIGSYLFAIGYGVFVSGPKASKIINDIKEEKGGVISVKEKAKATWKEMIPVVAGAVAGTVCIAGAQKITLTRLAAVSLIANSNKERLNHYKDKVKELVGEKKMEDVKNDISSKMNAGVPNDAEHTVKSMPQAGVVFTSKRVRVYDTLSGRYVDDVDLDRLTRGEYEIKKQMVSGDFVTLNDVYYAIGLPSSKLGDEVGWKDDTEFEIRRTSRLDNKDEPCLVVDFDTSGMISYYNKY